MNLNEANTLVMAADTITDQHGRRIRKIDALVALRKGDGYTWIEGEGTKLCITVRTRA